MLDTDFALRATPHRLTRAEYHRLVDLGFFQDAHIELIHGILVDMSPVGSAHRMVVDRLMRLLVPALAGRAAVASQQPYRAARDSEPAPDVSVCPLRDTDPDRAYLIIEVADKSLDYDRTTKANLYAASSVQEYWVVNLEQRMIEIHGDAVDGQYTITSRAEPGALLTPRAFPDVIIDVRHLLT